MPIKATGALRTIEGSSSSLAQVAETTYGTLRLMVMSGELPPGHVLEERPLARKLDVSRTPLRSAMDRLLGEGLLTRLSNGTLIVGNLGFEAYLEILRLRALLEAEAAARAAGMMPAEQLAELRARVEAFSGGGLPDKQAYLQLDEDLHTAIAEAASSPILCELIVGLRSRARLCSASRLPGRRQETCREHLDLIDRLAAGDADGARRAMAEHVDGVRQACLKAVIGR